MENNQNNNKNQKNDKRGWILVLIITLITGFLVFTLFDFAGNATSEEIRYDEFLEMLEDGDVKEVIIGNDQLVITPKSELDGSQLGEFFQPFQMTYYTGVVEDETTLTARLDEADVQLHDAQDVKGWRYYGHWEKQCQNVC